MKLQQWLLAAVSIAILTNDPAPSGAQMMLIVTGVVSAPDGSIVANASVEAWPIPRDKSRGIAGHLYWIHADNQGKFRIELAPGRYVIRAKDEADGYPDPNSLLAADPSAKFPTISVDRTDISEVKVVLGRRGGILDGELRDEVTQVPVLSGKVTISDARKPQAFVEVFADKRGHFRYAVPGKPLLIAASAPGYTGTVFQNGKELTLSGGEHRNISIELRHK